MSTVEPEKFRTGPMANAIARLLAEAIEELSAAEGTVWLVSANGENLQAALNIGPTREIVEASSVPIAESVVGMVASSGLATCIGPDDWHNPDIDRVTGTATVAMAVAPLQKDDDIVGVVSVINPLGGVRFSGTNLDTLQWKALLMGTLLESRLADGRRAD